MEIQQKDSETLTAYIHGSLARASYATDATNVVTSTDTVGIGYHHQEQLVHPKAITAMEDNHYALDTL